jgi:hypothetical protein
MSRLRSGKGAHAPDVPHQRPDAEERPRNLMAKRVKNIDRTKESPLSRP